MPINAQLMSWPKWGRERWQRRPCHIERCESFTRKLALSETPLTQSLPDLFVCQRIAIRQLSQSAFNFRNQTYHLEHLFQGCMLQ